MNKQKRLIALLMCVGMLLILFVSSAYIVHEAGHDCTGEDCPICEFIAQVERVQRGFGMVLLALLLMFLVLTICNFHRGGNRESLPASDTLVSWKIRLNN